MSLVTLVSGGLDSTLMSVLAADEGVEQFPLFINYGQLCAQREWETVLDLHRQYSLPTPKAMNLKGFGEVVASGITDSQLRIYEDAFLPGRNLLFLLAGAAYAYQVRANAVAIGLLSEEHMLFPDQGSKFLGQTEDLLSLCLGQTIRVVAPLMEFTKGHVLELAHSKGIEGTYSCHAGQDQPCGICVSCREIMKSAEQEVR